MKRIAVIVALALVACEGEPPKTPAGQAGPPLRPAEMDPADEAPRALTAATTSPTTPCACACNCTGSTPTIDGGAATATADAAASVAVEPAPPPATKGTVLGTLTTTPKGQAGNGVVYLEDAPIEPTAKMAVTIDNHMMNFTPFVAVVPVGGKVAFHNSDPFPHNVFSPDNEKFDMGAIPQNQSRVRTFKSAGHYTVLCNLHPGMIGYVVASPSSYFAKTDGKGRYKLQDVPNGTYKITAWAPRQQPVTQSVAVKGGEVTLDFELHR
jgi:plastocyanin